MCTDNADSTPYINGDARNIISIDKSDIDDNATIPQLETKANKMEENILTAIQDILYEPPPTRQTIVNDKSTTSSNLTMDTCMHVVESNMVKKNWKLR